MKQNSTFFAIIMAVCCYVGNLNAAVRYVKPTASGNGSGSDWANASADLQAIIDASSSGDEVWVATGVYKPSGLSGGTGILDSRDLSFVLKSGVKVYGGFGGTETLLSQQNPSVYQTILSGDIGIASDRTDNAYHVVIAVNNDAGTLLDGFTIMEGYANGTGDVYIDGQTIMRNVGGGIFARGSSAVFNQVTVYDSQALGTGSVGGAAYIYASNIQIRNAKVMANISVGVAGGIYTRGNADSLNTISISDSEFSYNMATTSGGGIYNHNFSDIELTNVTFSDNEGTNAGALFLFGSSDHTDNLIANNITLLRNKATATAGVGGALYLSVYTSSVLNGVTAVENQSGGSGGAIYATGNEASFSSVNIKGGIVSNNATVTGGSGGGAYIGANVDFDIQNITFTDNRTVNAGGAMFLFGNATIPTTNAIVANCVFNANQANSASLGGGGIYVSNSAKPTITNCTFYANYSKFGGGGIGLFSNANTNATVANCILYNNTSDDVSAPDIHKGANATLTLVSSITQVYSTGTGLIIGVNPLFASTDPETGNFLMLNLGSPAIDAGDDSYIAPGVTTDLAGQSRKYNGTTVDMGAFENQGINPLPVVLNYFTAKAGLNSVELEWETLSEQNNDYFVVERSTDGKLFTTITKISGQGTTSSATSYTAVDYSPVAGINYYRLKQVDKDGKAVVYDIKALEFKIAGEEGIKIYPNPVSTGTFTVDLNNGKYNKIDIVNIYGKIVKSIPVNGAGNTLTIDVYDLPAAVYQLRATGEFATETNKFVKN